MAMLVLDDTTMLERPVLVETTNAMIMHKFRWAAESMVEPDIFAAYMLYLFLYPA